MKLFFDARYIRTDFHDGISRYSSELAKATSRLMPVTYMISDLKQLEFLPEHTDHILMHTPTSIKEPLTSLILNKYHPDVVFSPMQTMGSIGHTFKLILTTHDLIYYRHKTPPRNLNILVRMGWVIFHLNYMSERRLLNAADAVATVSETTKRELLQARLTKRSITVIPNAPQKLEEFLNGPPSLSSSGPKNLIYMGSFMPYKNVEALIKAMQWLPDHTLHLLSRITPSRKIELTRLIPNNASIVFHNGVTDKQYAQLLADNAALVTASFDEGYGLPIAEALELGVVAVVSDLAIFHEVAGEGALYANPQDPHDFAKKILALSDVKICKQLTTAGQKHITQYSWNRSAKSLVLLAESLM